MKVPLYQAAGEYTVKIGLYNKSGRFPIKDQPESVENAFMITKIMIE